MHASVGKEETAKPTGKTVECHFKLEVCTFVCCRKKSEKMKEISDKSNTVIKKMCQNVKRTQR